MQSARRDLVEKTGVPTVAVITSAFVDAAVLVARVRDARLWLCRRGVSHQQRDEELADKARQVLVQAERLLLG